MDKPMPPAQDQIRDAGRLVGGMLGRPADDIRVILRAISGYQLQMAVPTYALREMPVIESMALELNSMPIVRVPFAVHGKSLHTLCRGPEDIADRLIELAEGLSDVRTELTVRAFAQELRDQIDVMEM